MTTPRFAAHLPPGELLDWAWRTTTGDGLRTCPSAETVKATWDRLDDVAAAGCAATSTDADLLDWIARIAATRPGVRSSLLRNPATAAATVALLVADGVTPGDRDALVASRTPSELCALHVAGHDVLPEGRKGAAIAAAGCAASTDPATIPALLTAVGDDWRSTVLRTLLDTDPAGTQFPLDTLVADLAGEPSAHPDALWRRVGAHLATRGSDTLIGTALDATASSGLRGALFAGRRIDLARAVDRANANGIRRILEALPDDRPLDVDDVRVLCNLEPSRRPTGAFVHQLSFTAAAIDTVLADGPDDLAASVAWKSDNDAALLRVLRTNPASYHYARGHLWRLARIWTRLSRTLRHTLVGALPAETLAQLTPGPIRDWILTDGDAATVSALTLRRTDTKVLVERVEANPDPDLAWTAALVAERPKDRVRMAELACRAIAEVGTPAGAAADDRLRTWTRAASSGEVVRLWQQLDDPTRDRIGPVLVAALRGGDETSWVDRLVGDLRIDWQSAPVRVQEAAAVWLAARTSGETAWEAIWALYPGWTGTLAELAAAAKTI